MRILQVVHSFPTHNMAGTEIYTYSLSREMSNDNEVFIFYRVSDLKKKEYELSYGSINGFNVVTINNTFRFCDCFEKFYKNDAITERFADALDKIRPDIVHIQHLIFLSTTIIDEIKKRGIPIVFTLHDYWLICPQWHFLKNDLSICDNNALSQCVDCLGQQLSIKKLPKNIYLAFRHYMPDFIMRFLKKIYLNTVRGNLDSQEMTEKIKSRLRHIKQLCFAVDLFIAPSQFLRSRFIEFGIPENKIKFISHGINRESFNGLKRKSSDIIRFGFIGTILPAKGVDVLINAFSRIKDERIELKVFGSLVPYRNFEYYPHYIKRLTKNKNIRFMGGFDNKDISSIFSKIDILVFPSIWNENCPLIILEALCTKTPIIASRIGGVPELIKDNQNGLLFESNNPDDLYDKMRLFINRPDLIERFKMNISVPKSIGENRQEIEELYRGLLSKSSV